MRRSIRSLLFKLPYMLNCREFEEFINDYLDGNLPASVSKKVYLHLRGLQIIYIRIQKIN